MDKILSGEVVLLPIIAFMFGWFVAWVEYRWKKRGR